MSDPLTPLSNEVKSYGDEKRNQELLRALKRIELYLREIADIDVITPKAMDLSGLRLPPAPAFNYERLADAITARFPADHSEEVTVALRGIFTEMRAGKLDLTPLIESLPAIDYDALGLAVASRLPADLTPQVAETLQKVTDELRGIGKKIKAMSMPIATGPSRTTIKNTTENPVPVTLAESTGTWGYESSTLTSGSLSATGNCMALRVFAATDEGTFNISGGDTITVRGDTGFDLGPDAKLVDPVINWVSGTLDVFVAVLA